MGKNEHSTVASWIGPYSASRNSKPSEYSLSALLTKLMQKAVQNVQMCSYVMLSLLFRDLSLQRRSTPCRLNRTVLSHITKFLLYIILYCTDCILYWLSVFEGLPKQSAPAGGTGYVPQPQQGMQQQNNMPDQGLTAVQGQVNCILSCFRKARNLPDHQD